MTDLPLTIAPAYSTLRIYLHWVSATVILWATFSGFGVALLAQDDPLRQWVESTNPQLTSVFIPIFMWRLWLAVTAPQRIAPLNIQARMAHWAHMAMYAVVSGVLITGVLMMTHPVNMLALFALPQLVHSATALTALHNVHHALCAVLAGLVTLHVLAVVQHQVSGKPVLGRML
ncbi:cytochrome b/b6 domain-containing protein [Pseudomonas huanghezhanensis]|uniref:cytochrome b/b6 domain-containing protein n=1 Tax=Pseudomonas huanghezhanensis TaxID=3002903 RepID=UPI0022858B54|nr:cytochrome b/b6 domain-containing protein [Pseudomonas sp. BSw22131]